MNKFKNLAFAIAGLALGFSGVGFAHSKSGTPLDKVMLQVSAEKWVTTQSAKISVNINATMGNSNLANFRAQIHANLAKIAKVTWHITRFSRTRDRSGLERISVSAQARVPETKLANLRSQAKRVSRPGANYQIGSIDFKPSAKEFEQARADLRKELYSKIKAEIARVNELYSGVNYSAYRINFVPTSTVRRNTYQQGRMMKMAVAAAPAPMTVSNKMTIGATVILAANRKAAKAA